MEGSRCASRFTLRRACSVTTRTGHLLAMSVFFGGMFVDSSFHNLVYWRIAVVATGLVLLIFEISESKHWFYQIRGILTTLHILLYFSIVLFPDHSVLLLALALIVGAFGSHFPRIIRKWSLIHRRMID